MGTGGIYRCVKHCKNGDRDLVDPESGTDDVIIALDVRSFRQTRHVNLKRAAGRRIFVSAGSCAEWGADADHAAAKEGAIPGFGFYKVCKHLKG